ncbi:MAG: hypothetical protein J6Q79_03285 [Clostridia bacterium]|nr:hypothetical protein [Clostridia bacterium]
MSKLKYITVCLVALLTVFALIGCGITAETKKMGLSDKEVLTVSTQNDDNIFLSAAKTKSLKKITSSGMLEMYLDEKTLAVCILDTISGKMWRSLPSEKTKEKSANLIADIIIKGNIYTLNSQRDSLALGCARYEADESGVVIYYTFRKSLDNGKKIDLTIPLSLTLSDGSFSAKVDCNKIEDNSSAKIYLRSLYLLPCFGAETQGKKGDFILLPSASGVILDTKGQADAFEEISLPVYGEDIAKTTEQTGYVPIGVFGMKSGDSAFMCLIDSGEAVATVKATKAVKNISYNRVGAEFEITPTVIDEDTIYLSKKSYSGELSLSYRFLSSNNADYITMAGACRELLIRKGVLTDSNINSDTYPFNLTLVANDEDLGIATSEEEITELISALSTKGIGNINIMLKDDGTADIPYLSSFASRNALSLSLYKNLFSHSGKGSINLKGKENPYGIGTAKAEKNADSIIRTMRNNSVGVCLADCGHLLLSDYSRFHFTGRSNLLENIASLCTAISSHGALTVSSPNIYTVKYADSIINIPEKSPLEDNIYCTGVPFLQAVLHGICDYSFTAINLSSDPTTAILKSIEYGAVPHYEWYFGEYKENDPMHYMNSLSQARLLYENAKNVLGNLRDQRITSHEQVKKNVSCTVYSGGSEIYVNYNNEAVSVGGITVDPMSFLRVN